MGLKKYIKHLIYDNTNTHIDGEYRHHILGNEFTFHKCELCLLDKNCLHQEIDKSSTFIAWHRYVFIIFKIFCFFNFMLYQIVVLC